MTTAEVKQPANVVVDVASLKDIGEVWVKDSINFDHPKIQVKTIAILLDGPLRKLCFNTYDGTLGKKAKDLSTLRLEEFKKDEPVGGKPVGYRPKRTIQDERAQLEKSGYKLVE